MKASAWIMLIVGCVILYGGLAYSLGLAMGLFGKKKRKEEKTEE